MKSKMGKAEEQPRSSVAAPQQTVLIVGKSNTGKSYLARDLVQGLGRGRPVYVVNDASPQKPFRKVDWDSLKDIRKASLIMEDIISCTDKEFKEIQKVLSYYCHHHALQPAIVICHSVLKNRIYSVLAYVNFVYFTRNAANVSSIAAALRYFRFTKEEEEECVRKFLADKTPFGYWVLKVESHSFERHSLGAATVATTDSGESSDAFSTEKVGKPTREDFGKAAERFLTLLPEPKIALAAFDIIIRKIPLGSISRDDLSIELRGADSKGKLTLSLIDYLHVLTSTNTRPSSDMVRLHRYVRKYVKTMPRLFQKNRHLQ